jgi:hypothetical protein
MQALCGERLLAVWDRAQGEHELDRALTLLAAALPEIERTQLAELTIAERNYLLLRLRQLTFGPTLQGFGRCAACDAPIEFSLPVDHVLAQLTREELQNSVDWYEHGEHLQLRAINTLDLLAALEAVDAAAAEELLLARCLRAGDASHAACSPAASTTVREHFERLHAATELRCALTCPRCSRNATLDLDVVHFLWLEVRHAAQRLLADIHTLARHYGWTERDITCLSPQRRHAYLELLAEMHPS